MITQVGFPLQHHNTTYFLPTFTGLILKLPIWGQPPDQNCYDDSVYWEVLYSVLNTDVNYDTISESFAHLKPTCVCGISGMKLDALPMYIY